MTHTQRVSVGRGAGLLPLLIFALRLMCCTCITVTYPEANNYNYPTTTLLDVTNPSDQSFEINVNFDIRFRGQTYRKFWVNTNSIIYFADRAYTTFTSVQNSGAPRLEINAQRLNATRIVVRSTN